MPYKNMRGLGMKIKINSGDSASSDRYTNRYVIHSTTDKFTVGSPASKGCLRVSIEDMLKLFSLTAPDVKEGEIKIPLEIKYNLVEIKDDCVILHANIYNRETDYLEEFKEIAKKQGIEKNFNYEKASKLFAEAEEEFKTAHKKVLEKLTSPYPKNFVSEELKGKLHKIYKISELQHNIYNLMDKFKPENVYKILSP